MTNLRSIGVKLILVSEGMVEIRRTYGLLLSFDPAISTRAFHIGATDYLLSQITGRPIGRRSGDRYSGLMPKAVARRSIF